MDVPGGGSGRHDSEAKSPDVQTDSVKESQLLGDILSDINTDMSPSALRRPEKAPNLSGLGGGRRMPSFEHVELGHYRPQSAPASAHHQGMVFSGPGGVDLSRHAAAASSQNQENNAVADPSYFSYYYSHRPLDPRLPPPVQQFGDNWSDGDGRNGSGSAIAQVTAKQRPDSPTRSAAGGIIAPIPTAVKPAAPAWGGKPQQEITRRPLVDQIQNDFPRTPSPVVDGVQDESGSQRPQSPAQPDEMGGDGNGEGSDSDKVLSGTPGPGALASTSSSPEQAESDAAGSGTLPAIGNLGLGGGPAIPLMNQSLYVLQGMKSGVAGGSVGSSASSSQQMPSSAGSSSSAAQGPVSPSAGGAWDRGRPQQQQSGGPPGGGSGFGPFGSLQQGWGRGAAGGEPGDIAATSTSAAVMAAAVQAQAQARAGAAAAAAGRGAAPASVYHPFDSTAAAGLAVAQQQAAVAYYNGSVPPPYAGYGIPLTSAQQAAVIQSQLVQQAYAKPKKDNDDDEERMMFPHLHAQQQMPFGYPAPVRDPSTGLFVYPIPPHLYNMDMYVGPSAQSSSPRPAAPVVRESRSRDRDRRTPPAEAEEVVVSRSSLLEEFRNSKNRTFEISDIEGHVVEFSGDQHGSRFIQQKLETASSSEKTLLFNEIFPHVLHLMTDVFGNYVIQKFFDHGSDEQIAILGECLVGHVLPLTLQMYGCRVIQKALEVISDSFKVRLVRELDGHVLQCVKDQNGNHVIQKAIEQVPCPEIQFILDAFFGNVQPLATHPYGCRVIQRLLEFCDQERTMPITKPLLNASLSLVQDQYGNYVIQHILEHGTREHKSLIISALKGNIVRLSMHKFASNVIEKCVEYGTMEERNMIVEEVMRQNREQLLQMMKDQYGNYVIQKMLDVVEDRVRDQLVARIRVHTNALKKYTFGRHILTRVDRINSRSRSRH